MRKVVYGIAVASLGLAVVLTLPPAAWSFPAIQRLPMVSDGAPYCAACHSSISESCQPELPATRLDGAVQLDYAGLNVRKR